MINRLTSFLGSRNERLLKKLKKQVNVINKLEPKYAKMPTLELKNQTNILKNLLKTGKKLDDILEDAFAITREASKRTLGLRHFDSQIIGGIVLHQGKISEMGTGEGKTLAATLAVYLNALEGKGVHVVTVNDYLAHRDCTWMQPLYIFLGLSVKYITSDLSFKEKFEAYHSDITYGTNNEFGFDFLRDNTVMRPDHLLQNGFNFAIVDEIDSILIDEARTPLIISGESDDISSLYVKTKDIVEELESIHFEIDEKTKNATLSDTGFSTVEDILTKLNLTKENTSLYDPENLNILHALMQSIKAKKLFQKNTDYIIIDDEVVLIDEFTGRASSGRRFSDGLHQALEAKEGVSIKPENQTVASITFQNYFKFYKKLSGMTGTADTEAEEFYKVYSLEVVVIPPNQKNLRKDKEDIIFLNEKDKMDYITKDIIEQHTKGRPVLVGTISIEKSEEISRYLTEKEIPHNILNAKHHEKEAGIIAQAGRLGAVTVATNMAGRGTDIILGGNPDLLFDEVTDSIRDAFRDEADKVQELGGLYILATERHESRRIDNQLRGRAGRQGDAGETRFFLSMDDNLIRVFGGDNVKSMLASLGFKKGEIIEHPWISKSVRNAQKKIEGQNFDARKDLLEYDNVISEQRNVFNEQRRSVLLTKSPFDYLYKILNDEFLKIIKMYSLHGVVMVEDLSSFLKKNFNFEINIAKDSNNQEPSEEELTKFLLDFTFSNLTIGVDDDNFQDFSEAILDVILTTMDSEWKANLQNIEYLKNGISLRGFAQKDPRQEYKKESYELFIAMMDSIKFKIVHSALTQAIQIMHDTNDILEDRTDIIEGDFVKRESIA